MPCCLWGYEMGALFTDAVASLLFLLFLFTISLRFISSFSKTRRQRWNKFTPVLEDLYIPTLLLLEDIYDKCLPTHLWP
jgi:hypothetical protein